MNKGYYSRALSLASVFLLFISSCTYDYFEDETNYVVYVPKADKNLRTETYSIDELGIYIYSGDALNKERYSYQPFTENPRSEVGNFNFRLYPGSYEVYCFSNLQEIKLQEQETYSRAGFCLAQAADGTYKEPPAIYVDYLTPTIHFPGPAVYDTAYFERKYVGRICIAFKNLIRIDPRLSDTNIKEIEIEATGIGVRQYLTSLSDSINTRSTRDNRDDMMRLSSTPFSLSYKDFTMGVQNYYFPSPDLSAEGAANEPISLQLKFKGSGGEVLATLAVSVIDDAGQPIVLHTNETLIVEVDGNIVKVFELISPEQWNPIIEQEPGTGPGGGGTEL